MTRVVPWQKLIALIEPHYPKGKTGRPPFPIQTMLRIHFLHVWTRRVLQASFVT
jgi:IS5 family transposase